MLRLTDKYFKIFKLEGEQGYENRAVIGGMQKLGLAWPAEAREAGLPEALIPKVSAILSNYPALEPRERRSALLEVGKLLEITNIGSLPAVLDSAAWGERHSGTSTSQASSAGLAKPAQKPAEGKSKAAEKKTGTRRKESPRRALVDETLGLDAAVNVIRGVGEKQATHLTRLGVNSIKDLLYLFPRRYDDYSKLKTISQLRFGEEVTIVARVVDLRSMTTKNHKKIIEASVSDTTGILRLLWFNQDFHLRYLREGMFISISGSIDTYLGRPVIYHPDYEPIDQQQLNTNRIVPVYPLTASVTQKWLRRTQFNTVAYWAEKVEDFLPDSVREQAEVPGIQAALAQIHFPDSQDQLKQAQARFAFDELFLLQLGVIRQKWQWQELVGTSFKVDNTWVDQQIKRLPYTLTNAQMAAFRDIRGDLALEHPMNRLLQGDVGSGKTIVAVLGMAIVIVNGAQAALMAPTGILADQHYRTLFKLLAESSDGMEPLLEAGQVRLLTGDTSQTERQEILAGLASGWVKLLVGTHALIEDPVSFQRLQMVVVDEQHRFGVAQRAALRAKGENPHLLVMTATPIPRSLEMTIFGDLDVSVMNEMPLGRLPIETHVAFPAERERVYRMIRSQAAQGNQAFIVYPLVEQGENEEIKAAVDEQERLQREAFPELRVGLVHGRMKAADKDAIMLAFRNQEFDVLVSTSVVEVGVDIPHATVMVIEGANRFGLAQLHQFRGRVGRGDVQSYCILIPDEESTEENERLRLMTQTNDGFVLAEHDLRMRGPGDFLGTRQAGLTSLNMANLADTRLIQKARSIAQELLEKDPDLQAGEDIRLKKAVEDYWPSADGGGDVS